MKILNREDIKKQNDEYDLLERWNTVKAWAEKYYGVGKVSRLEVHIVHEFNDGDPEYPSVSSVSVYNTEGEDAEPDESLPAFKDARRDWDDLKDYIDNDELPATEDDAEYDLTKEPAISYPQVVALENRETIGVFENIPYGWGL